MDTISVTDNRSMYGVRGWTVTSGLVGVLWDRFRSPFLGDYVLDQGDLGHLEDFVRGGRFDSCHWVLPDYLMVKPFDGRVAAAVMGCLVHADAGVLGEHQNEGPTLGDLLVLAADSVDVFLGGYLIGPTRWDERLTVTTVFLRTVSDDPVADLRWRFDQLGLGSGFRVPDECDVRGGIARLRWD
jgi:hypothetical protein